MSAYQNTHDYQHGEVPAVGLLLSNLGTPEAPTAKALRPYLREFLSDPRVIEIPRWRWKLILNLFILPFRPAKSAKLYRSIWTEEGSPLLVNARKQTQRLAEILANEIGTPTHVVLGMRYGNPSIASALHELRDHGCQRILVLPLYPQYFAGTTATTVDAVAQELMTWRRMPELRTILQYHDDPAYIAALAKSIAEAFDREAKPERLVFSFHGIPERYLLNGDPYHCHCHKTGRLVAEKLGLAQGDYVVTFQSLFGREEWIKPYTDRTIQALAASGVKSMAVVCPGFSADCLETLEEIDRLNRGFFKENGGDRFQFIPCLNERPDHLRMLADLIRRHLQGWVVTPAEWDADAAQREAQATAQRAQALIQAPPTKDAGFGSSTKRMSVEA